MARISSSDRDFSAAFDSAVRRLSDRSREFLSMRFGASGQKPQTLDSIGQKNGITRERVRQIISSALRSAHSGLDAVSRSAYDAVVAELESRSGIGIADDVVATLGGDDPRSCGGARFFLALAEPIEFFSARPNRLPVYALADFDHSQWENFVSAVSGAMERENRLMNDNEFAKILSSEGIEHPFETVEHFLAPSTALDRNCFGLWGLTNWSSVRPRSVREKIFLVLEREKTPLHFSKIAEKIDEVFGGAKKTHIQTVHNELIKDPRFVLVGRGTYGLSSWGHSEGTVKEVVERILKNAGKPLSTDEIVAAVLKERNVKPATIVVNLKANFKRAGDRYTV